MQGGLAFGCAQARVMFGLEGGSVGHFYVWNSTYFGLVYVLFSMTAPVVWTPVEAHSKSTSAGLLFGMILCDDVFCTGPVGFIRSG